MQHRPVHIFIDWSRNEIVLDLRRRTNDYDLVFEKRAVVIIGVPEFIVKNLPERFRLVGVRRAKPDKMGLQVAWQVLRPTQFFEGASTERNILLLGRA